MPNLTVKLTRRLQDKLLKKRLSGERGQLYTDLVEIKKDIPYGEHGSFNTLDVLCKKGASGKLPTVIVVHGGGYVACCKETNLLQSRYFASCGLRVVNVNYQLMPEVGFKEVMQDLFKAFEWVGANAEEYGFDLDKIGLTGDSAGGHFVILAAALLSGEKLRELYEVKQPDYKLNKIAATCPVAEVSAYLNPTNQIDKVMAKSLGKEGLSTLRAFPYVSPTQFIDLCDYPEIFILTTEDDTMLYPRSREVHSFLERRGVKHIYKEYGRQSHKLEHVFNVSYPEWEESVRANNDIINYLFD